MRIETVSIEKLKPAGYNPRQDLKPGDPAYEKLVRSIEEHGYVQPLVWNKTTGNLVGGHQRLKVLIAQGFTELDVVVVELTPEKEKALNLALNKIQGDWDDLKLAKLLDELITLPEFDLALTGFDLPEAQEIIDEVLRPLDEDREEDFDPNQVLDTTKPAVTQRGDLLELGNHRLLCGDSTSPEDVRRVMNGKRAILFATDPPYLVNYTGTNHPASRSTRAGKNKDWTGSYGPEFDWDDPETNPDLYEKFYAVAVAEAIRPDAAWYCWHASRRQAMVEGVWQKHGAFVHQQIIWVKDRPVLTYSWFTWQHEPCFFGWVRPNKPPRAGDAFLSSVWQIPTTAPGKVTEHPTSKPVELFAIPMRQHTKRHDICYEPFCGSGSQLIAAERLGRRCFALEISPHYCDLIVRRWIAFVGPSRAPAQLAERYREVQEVKA
jgi:DNA modification methylase